MNYLSSKLFLFGLLLASSTSCLAQKPPATVSNVPTEALAAWLARVQPLPFPAQVAALRERLRADARRTFRNDPSQMPVCFTGVPAATREAWEAARRSVPDTVVHDYRLLCVVNGRQLSGPVVAAAVADVPSQASKAIKFLTGISNTVLHGDRGTAGVVQVTVEN